MSFDAETFDGKLHPYYIQVNILIVYPNCVLLIQHLLFEGEKQPQTMKIFSNTRGLN